MAGNTQLANILAFLKETWGIELDAARIAGWEDELANGTGRGRSIEKLRNDIMKHVVTDERIRAYVQAAFDDRGMTLDPDRLERIVGEFMNEQRSFKEFNETMDSLQDKAKTTANTPVDDVDLVDKEYGGFLDGGTIHIVDNDEGQEDFYVIRYEYPPGSGKYFVYHIGDLAKLESYVGPGGYTLEPPLTEDEYNSYVNGGDANEVGSIPGTFLGYIKDIIDEAGLEAGNMDPTAWGDALNDPGIALLLAQASEAGWSEERLQAELRLQEYYTDVLYPGIEHFYGGTNPEAAYAMYTQNAVATLKSLGIPADADGSYGLEVEKLLDAGVDDTQFATFGQVYKQAQTSMGFADSLSKWTTKFTGIGIETFEDYYDVIAGQAPAEILEIAELAGLQFMADNQGFQILDSEISALGEATGFSQEGAGQLFSQTAKNLLALGESGLRRGGLTSNEVLEAEAGIGGNSEAIKLRMSKLAKELGIQDDPTAAIFTDFNREGAPIKKGLESTISEGA